jgi:predicted aspartyl protease
MPIDFGSATGRRIVTTANGAERALAEVQLFDPIRNLPISRVIRCVIDTASQYTILPQSDLDGAGIPPGPVVPIRTIAGTVASFPSQQVDLLIEGQYHINATVLSSSAVGFTPVLGLLEAKDAFDFGFDFSNWYFG